MNGSMVSAYSTLATNNVGDWRYPSGKRGVCDTERSARGYCGFAMGSEKKAIRGSRRRGQTGTVDSPEKGRGGEGGNPAPSLS